MNLRSHSDNRRYWRRQGREIAILGDRLNKVTFGAFGGAANNRRRIAILENSQGDALWHNLSDRNLSTRYSIF